MRLNTTPRGSGIASGKTWARLTDGTPLVTGERRGQGYLVLIHTTANTGWSNLALSGLFVDMLQRLVTLIGAAVPQAAAAEVMRLRDEYRKQVGQ